MKKFGVLFLLLFALTPLKATLPPLEREVSLSFSKASFSTVLISIQEQTGLVFSYKPSVLRNIPPVSLQLRNKTVREALALMLPKSITYKTKNNYIILKEKPEEKNPKTTEISGYVYDKKTKEKVANVTIYDKESLQSVTTDQYGFYSISVPGNNSKISINKQNYEDTTLLLNDLKENKFNNISIAPVNEEKRKQDSTNWRDRLKELGLYTNQIYKKFNGFINTLNVKDTIHRKIQVSLIPFVGTNHKLSGNVINNLSFNLIGGFAKGLDGFEVGTLFNIDRANVNGTQLAGTFNIVGDSVKGSQLAGYFNITGDYMKGFQAAGFMNMNSGRFSGMQLASLMNIDRRGMKGASIAGMMNISGSVRGAQLAGLGNINDTLRGITAAGMFNTSNHGVKALQVAGMFNKQKTGTTYLQVAGLLNKASYLKGLQLGVFNFCDSATGVPVGLFSFVKKGVHQLEINGDELFATNLSLRTGVHAFYNVFSAGLAPGSNKNLWQLGYGLGTSFRITRKLRSDIVLSMHHVSSGNFYFATNELYRFYFGLEYQVRKKFSIAAGPTFNLLMSDALLPDYSTYYKDIVTHPIFNTTNADAFNFKGWMGCRIALRFL